LDGVAFCSGDQLQVGSSSSQGFGGQCCLFGMELLPKLFEQPRLGGNRIGRYIWVWVLLRRYVDHLDLYEKRAKWLHSDGVPEYIRQRNGEGLSIQ
jgi:hypothetical protein